MPSLIVAELVYVLESVYEQTRAQVAALMRSVLAHPPVRAAEGSELLRAVELYETAGVHFAGACLAAIAEQADGLMAFFDRELDRIETVTRVEP